MSERTTSADSIDQIDGTFNIRLGPHKPPRIECGKCGTEHHYDATNGEFIGRCRNCLGFLRRPTEAEHEQFTEFLVWNDRHLNAETDGEPITDGGQAGLPDTRFISHPDTKTLHRGDPESGPRCGTVAEEWDGVEADDALEGVLQFGRSPCQQCFTAGYHTLNRVYLKEHTAVRTEVSLQAIVGPSQWSLDEEGDQ